MSKLDHENWKAQQREAAKRQGQRMDYGRQQQGWLDRKAVWDRPCMIGAVGSVVIKIKGMQLEVKENGWIDRIGAAHQVKQALMIGAAMQERFRDCMLYVVCSKATVEGTGASAGVSRVSCTFYMRLPASWALWPMIIGFPGSTSTPSVAVQWSPTCSLVKAKNLWVEPGIKLHGTSQWTESPQLELDVIQVW